MFKRTLAVAVSTVLLGLGPMAAGAKTHHHHKHHMMSSTSSMMQRSSAHTTHCRDKKTGRFIKCAK